MATLTILITLLLGVALAQDPTCDFSQNLIPGRSYNIYSPGFPNNYSGGLACRWVAYAPTGYQVVISCPEISIPQSSNCYLDRLLVSTSGDPQLNSADRYCGSGTLNDISDSTTLSIGLISSRYSTGGRFRCQLYAQQSVTPPTPCTCGYKKVNRIVGGQNANENEFPMMAGVRYKDAGLISCGGVIIHAKYVLTAAHCVVTQSLSNVEVVLGEHNQDQTTSSVRQVIQPSRFIVHPQYSESNNDYDIAIIVLSKNIAFNNMVGPVCLPFKFSTNTFAGSKVTILGWGTIFFGGPTSSVLQKADVDVISQAACASSVSTLTARQMCTFTRGKDTCQMDSGGPCLYTDPSSGLLFVNGLASAGRSCASGSPGVNTRVTSFLDWIVTSTPDATYCRK